MIFQSNSNNCVMSAISVVRKFLGYSTDFEPGIPTQSPTEMTYLIKYYKKLFPNHTTDLFMNLDLQKELISRNMLKVEDVLPSFIDFYQSGRNIHSSNAIYIFDYVSGNIPMTHTVVGYPSILPGMRSQYILRVLIDYQLELL